MVSLSMESAEKLVQTTHYVHNGEGWVLAVKQTYSPGRLCRSRPPIAIVPEFSALSAYERMGSMRKEILRVGTEAVPVAHADLFVSDIAQQWVFEPLAGWLIAANQGQEGRAGRSRETRTSNGRAGSRRP